MRADRRVRPAELRVDVGTVSRRERARVDGFLQERRGARVVGQLRRREAEPDAGTGRRAEVPGVRRLLEQRAEDLARRFRLAADPQAELGVGLPELALVDVAELGAGLEVLGRDAEVAREHPERLDGRAPRAGLDPRDVRVRDALRRQLTLRQSPLEAEPSQPNPDRLLEGFRSTGLEPGILVEPPDGVNNVAVVAYKS